MSNNTYVNVTHTYIHVYIYIYIYTCIDIQAYMYVHVYAYTEKKRGQDRVPRAGVVDRDVKVDVQQHLDQQHLVQGVGFMAAVPCNPFHLPSHL